MTDLELTRLCAEAMGMGHSMGAVTKQVLVLQNRQWEYYDPLHDDAQAMQLVKRFRLGIGWNNAWRVMSQVCLTESHPDLNRAIVEAVAKMQKQKIGNTASA